MHPARIFQFERLLKEFSTWRAIPDDDRAPAAAWWWGTAMELRAETESMRPEYCAAFNLPEGACYADAASQLMASIAAQKSLTSVNEFPRRRSSGRPFATARRSALT
ncbi:conserved hypothetical protein [Rhodopseudomonas palustris BisB5]|uniref:Uncharacterized protein n=1 Tax=Rhodopseudomonas palustris (strain BisB5) TaxID=316057 RepID=Q13BE2_RHOPS|nr:conserved hypothetical protein [Rhodopseudomonas palustris BisB5]